MSEESLLSPAEAENADTDSSNQVTQEQSTWQWAEEVPGAGEAPEWLKADKYKSVADQAKAYTELEKKFGSFTGAPDAYEIPETEFFAKDIDLPEGVDFNLSKDDPLLQAFMPAAKEMGINQEGFNKLVGLYVQQQANDYAQTMTTAEEEKKRLGNDGDSRLNNIAKWAQANMDDALFQKFHDSLTTADAVEVFEYLISKTRNVSVPTQVAAPAPAESRADYEEAMGKKDAQGQLLYLVDPAYRRKVEEMGKRIFGDVPHRQIVG